MLAVMACQLSDMLAGVGLDAGSRCFLCGSDFRASSPETLENLLARPVRVTVVPRRDAVPGLASTTEELPAICIGADGGDFGAVVEGQEAESPGPRFGQHTTCGVLGYFFNGRGELGACDAARWVFPRVVNHGGQGLLDECCPDRVGLP